jgi:EmrB/QacA subfamily drug resistance transporter
VASLVTGRIAAGEEPGPHRGALIVILAGVFMASLDFFAVNVALPGIARGLHAGSVAIEWIVAGYGLAFAAGLITGGRLGDLVGRRRMFGAGLSLFVLASAACGLAPSAGFLVASRIVQGAAAALLFPQVLAIISTTWRGPAQVRAMNSYGLAAGLGSVFGQLVGGALIGADIAGLGWRAIFLLNVPVGAAALAALPVTVPRVPGSGRARLDVGGVAVVTAALVTVLFPLIEGRAQGWPSWTWLSLAFAAALLGVFLYTERRADNPLIPPSLFAERSFARGLVAQLAFNLGQAAFFLVLALYLQQGRGLTPLASGVLFLPLGLAFLFASLAARPLTARRGRAVAASGGLAIAAGELLLLAAVTHDASAAWLVPGLAATGAGMGLVYAPLATVILARVSPEHAGAAAGVLATTQQVGNAIGVAVVGVIFYASFRGYAHAFTDSLKYLVCVALALAVLVRTLPG